VDRAKVAGKSNSESHHRRMHVKIVVKEYRSVVKKSPLGGGPFESIMRRSRTRAIHEMSGLKLTGEKVQGNHENFERKQGQAEVVRVREGLRGSRPKENDRAEIRSRYKRIYKKPFITCRTRRLADNTG